MKDKLSLRDLQTVDYTQGSWDDELGIIARAYKRRHGDDSSGYSIGDEVDLAMAEKEGDWKLDMGQYFWWTTNKGKRKGTEKDFVAAVKSWGRDIVKHDKTPMKVYNTTRHDLKFKDGSDHLSVTVHHDSGTAEYSTQNKYSRKSLFLVTPRAGDVTLKREDTATQNNQELSAVEIIEKIRAGFLKRLNDLHEERNTKLDKPRPTPLKILEIRSRRMARETGTDAEEIFEDLKNQEILSRHGS